MQGTTNILARCSFNLCSLVLVLAILIPLQANAETPKGTDLKIVVDKQGIQDVRRLSYRTRHVRAERSRTSVSDWPFDRNETYLVYSGRISVTNKSGVLDDLMDQNQTFTMVVSTQTSPQNGSPSKLRLRFVNCKVVEREVQISKKGTIISSYFFSAEEFERD